MAERRIAEKTGQGVVCFISNYSWLDALSFTGMRERYLEVFDSIRIDCLNGDKYKTGKTTPDGSPDPSIFSTPEDPVGIQVGTAIATLVRKAHHTPAETDRIPSPLGPSQAREACRNGRGEAGRVIRRSRSIACPRVAFFPDGVSAEWFDWPALPDLFPVSFPGVKTNRDPFLVDIDLDRLKVRISDYFNADLSHDELAQRYPVIMKTVRYFDARSTRDTLLRAGSSERDRFREVCLPTLRHALALLGGRDQAAKRQACRIQGTRVPGEQLAIGGPASSEGRDGTADLLHTASWFDAPH